MEQPLDFVALGDIVTDAFIELEEAWVETDNPKGEKELCMEFGGELPYKDVVVVPAVGNSPNAAVSAHRLGLKSGLATNLGDDKLGKEDIEQLTKEGVNIDYTTIHEGLKSNYHYVLRLGAERTILIKHWEYPYKLPEFKAPPRYLYFSSVGENSLPYHHEIAEYVKNTPETKLVFQPGTFQISLGYETLKPLYEACELFFCNKEEAMKILETNTSDIPVLLKDMHARGPKIAVITDGPQGAYAFDGNEGYHMPMYPDPAPPVDRTGAGDSFSSTFTSALALGKSLPEAMMWGPINSMSVVQKIGAQEGLLTREKLEEYLSSAPDFYKPERII